ICGGRCWFANKTKLWGLKWYNKVCDTVRYLITLLKKKLPTIMKLIKKGILNYEQFEYPKINNGCEIIP
ncbi:MAG: putative peptide-modifying radical SAM/SPASM domain-containing protein, partial [Candidatus Odinarchaeia archaeon]